MSNITKVSLTMVPVSDQDAAIAFYTDKLGFEKRTDVSYGEGERWVEVAPPGGEATIALTAMRPEATGWELGRMTGIAVYSEDVKAEHARLTEAGVDCDDVADYGDPVPPMFWFRDQDGNTLLAVG